MTMPVRVAAIVPSGMLRCGFFRSPESPRPAIIPVKAGKMMAKTTAKLCGFSRVAVSWKMSGRIPSGAEPSRKAAMEPTRITETTHSTRTPRSAPFVSTSARSPSVAGTLTNRGSTTTFQLAPIQSNTGPNASPKATT